MSPLGNVSVWRLVKRPFVVNEEKEEGGKDYLEEDQELTSHSPNEYITQIGQYLLTLPQHLEPFSPNDNEAIKIALKHSIDVFTASATRSELQSAVNGVEDDPQVVERIEVATTELLLDAILRQTTRAFLEHLLHFGDVAPTTTSRQRASTPTSTMPRPLSKSMRRQIGVDLAYLTAVCEDLGLTTNDPEFAILLQVITELGNNSSNNYQSVEVFRRLTEQNPAHSRLIASLEVLFLGFSSSNSATVVVATPQ